MAAEGTLPLVRHAACAVAAASAVYATTLALSGGSHDVAEDITDFVHSAAAVRASSQSALSFERTRSKHAIALRPADDAAARRFLCASTAYFGADACFVCVQLSRGVRPRLWAGRLAHHAVQFAANGPALAGSSGRAVRPYLMLAYMAEASNHDPGPHTFPRSLAGGDAAPALDRSPPSFSGCEVSCDGRRPSGPV